LNDRSDGIRETHARIIADYLYEASRHLTSTEQTAWYEKIRADMDNGRAAFEWALENDPEVAVRLGAALWRFWAARGIPAEGAALIDRLLVQVPKDPGPQWGEAFLGRGVLARIVGANASTFHERALEIFESDGTPNRIAWALLNLGYATLEEGRNQ